MGREAVLDGHLISYFPRLLFCIFLAKACLLRGAFARSFFFEIVFLAMSAQGGAPCGADSKLTAGLEGETELLY